MRTGFYRISQNADPDPAPGPTPFPIQIVSATPKAESEAPLDEFVGKRSDDFYRAWAKFLAVQPKRAKKISRTARETEDQKAAAAGGGLVVKENAARSYEEAKAQCTAKVNAIVEECERLNEKYRDRDFNLEGGPNCLQSLMGNYPSALEESDPPPWVKRVEDIFDDPKFFLDGADANDVHQGSNGDCWFLAACMAIAAKGQLVEKLCVARNEKVGVYGFVFHRDGEWIHEVIDDKLFLRVGDDDDLMIVRDWNPMKKEGSGIRYDDDKLKEVLQKNGSALYFGHCKSNETWLPLIEKAYAKAHGDYAAIEGGFASEGIEDLTGGVAATFNPEDIMDKDRFWSSQLMNVNKKYLFGGGTRADTKGFIGAHAYGVLEAWEEGDLRLLKLRNPWGEGEWEGDWSDGSKLWTPEMMKKLNHTFGDDGIFWISYKDFLKNFLRINRVRLFDSSWSVSARWTCVDVPWTVDYLDTHFQFTIHEAGPVVIVLCQPDRRYFEGLDGRYLYSLHFRLYEANGAERYIVRSMHCSGGDNMYTRSVSAEVDNLKPGTYKVVLKITAQRMTKDKTAEENILKYATLRKEKLLHVGRRFDYAQSKGDLKGMEERVRKQVKENKREKEVRGMKKDRARIRQERERERMRKKRASEANKARQKQKKEERAKQGGTSANTPPSNESTAAQSEGLVHVDKADAQSDTQATGGSSEKNGEQNTLVALAATETQTTPSPDKTGEEEPSPVSTAEAETQTTEEKTDDHLALVSPISPDPAEIQGNKQPTPLTLVTLNLNDKSPHSSAPSSPATELSEDDFPWDSDLDAPISDDKSDEEEDADPSVIFGNDPWRALCVVGLRVYSQEKDMEVVVVEE